MHFLLVVAARQKSVGPSCTSAIDICMTTLLACYTPCGGFPLDLETSVHRLHSPLLTVADEEEAAVSV